MNDTYKSQFELLLQIIPFIVEEPKFALKVRNITNLLQQIQKQIQHELPDIRVQSASHHEGYNAKLFCISPKGFRIKIEVNTVMRGHLFETRVLPCVNKVIKEYQMHTEARILSHADLYGSKVCAALDRQHPRDLFDIYYLLKNEGIIKDIKIGFIVSLLSHKRPIHEILNPILIDQKQTYINKFKGVALVPFSYEDFEVTRQRLIDELNQSFEDNDKEFLLSFKSGNPKWFLIPEPLLKELPAIKWKMKNLKKLIETSPEKHQQQYEALKKKLHNT